MHKRVTRPRLKKLIEEHGMVTLSLYETGKDPDRLLTTVMEADIKNIEELDGSIKAAFKKSFGHDRFSIAIWEDEDE